MGKPGTAKRIIPQWHYTFPMLLLLCLGWLIILYTDLASNRGLFSLHFVVYLGQFAGLVGVIIGLSLSTVSNLRVAGLRTLFLSTVFLWFCFSEQLVANAIWNNWTEQTVSAGDELVTALESFQNEHGYYPDVLLDLTPDFLAQIPGLKFRYRYQGFDYWSDGDSFKLSFMVGNYTLGNYDSAKLRKWEIKNNL